MESNSISGNIYWYDYKSTKTPLDGKNYTRPLTGEEKETYDRLHAYTAETMVEISRSAETVQASDAQIDLLRGLRYPNQYFFKLKEMAPSNPLAKKTMETFIQKGHFFHGYVPSTHFDMIQDLKVSGGYKGYEFTMKAGKTACESLEKVISGLSLIDCSTTVQLAHYTAMRRVWGDAKFNHVFRFGSEFSFKVSCEIPPNPAKLFSAFRCYDRPLSNREIEIGQVYHLSNVSSYATKHPEAEGIGFFVCCISKDGDEPKVTGLGLPSSGVTFRQVEEHLIESFNSNPINAAEMYPKNIPAGNPLSSLIAEFIPKIESIDDFHAKSGGIAPFKLDLDPILINDIAQAATFDEVDRILQLASRNIGALCNNPRLNLKFMKKEKGSIFGILYPKLLNDALVEKK